MKMKIQKNNRNHSTNLNTSTMSTLPTDKQTKSSFVNDDYEYLINCTDLITTCQEALQENAQQQSELLQMKPQSHLQPNSAQIIIANCQPIQANGQQQQQQPQPQTNLLINCDQQNDLTSIRAPSSAASSGLGLSLEEDLSLKYCQSDEEFSSLNSNATTNESLMNTTNGPCSFTAKALVAEFIEWLDYIENQLDSVCYCAKIAQDINGEVLDGSDDDNELLRNKFINQSDKRKTENAINNLNTVNCNDLNEKLSTANIVLQRPNTNVDYDQNVVDEDEAEELMMSMPHINDNIDDDVNDESFVINNEFVHNLPKTASTAFNGGNSGDVESSAAIYMLGSSRKANLCLPENTMVNWSVIMARHESFQNEFEKITHQFFKNIRQITKPIDGGSSIDGIGVESLSETSAFDLKSSSNDTASVSIGNSTLFRSIEQQKNRCLLLWLKSLEYLTILQNHSGKRCPRHFSSNKSNLLNGIKVDSVDEVPTIVHHHHHQHFLLSNSSSINQTRTPSLIRSYSNILFGTKNTNSRLHRVYSTARKESSGGKTQSVELKSTGIGNSSVIIKNRRVQTSAQTSTAGTGTNNLNHNRSRNVANMIEQGESLICDTHSLDGSGSPGADSGVFSSSMDNSKYEIIQKDIGYSSDADMSDAIEAQPNSSDQSSSQRSAKKRQVRRRRTRTSRNRPWSFHADWTAWDYYQTPFICNDEHFSNEDLNYTNENIIRKLTEFGENYESWFANELDTDTDIRDIKPAVVIEKPEIEAYCEEPIPTAVEKNTADACISTSPIPFMDKECQANYEPQAEQTKNENDQLKMENQCTNDSKSTQTKPKTVRDSACSPVPPRVTKSKLINVKLDTKTNCNGCQCTKNTANVTSYSSIKFYTTIALAGLFSFLVAVTQFSPEIHKTYPRPPPL